MYTEDQLLPISALQHLMFCPRQCALIHLEQCWSENALTASGRIMHEKAHSGNTESRGDLRIVRSLRLKSLKLGLTGITDIVEFRRVDSDGIALNNTPGLWTPKIVEYKRGKPKQGRYDEIQLCAQAMCLEEMLDCKIISSQIFYGQKQRRYDIEIDNTLRELTREAVSKTHALIASRKTPPAQYSKKCHSCSLNEICMPQSVGDGKNVASYISRSIKRSLALEESQ